MSLYVRLEDKGSWKSEGIVVDQSSSDTFIAGGLRIEAIQSMKEYRISYNGIAYNERNEATHLRAIFV